MSWLSNLPPGLKNIIGKRETPDNLWFKCPISGELVYRKDLEAAWGVTPAGAHTRIGPRMRFDQLFGANAWASVKLPDVARDPLKFRDDRTYVSRLKAAKQKLVDRDKETAEGASEIHQDDCMAAACGQIGGREAVVLVQDFAFMGGSLGMAAGEAFITAAEEAIDRNAALIVFTASGGARMQEGTLSLMQMPRTTLAIQDVKAAGLPYLVVLTDPTSGGVSASYAMLGDVHLAEPGAMIAFSGPRVIEQTIREKLPEGFQTAEFLREKGMVDIVCHRRDLPETLARLLGHMMPVRANGSDPAPVEKPSEADADSSEPPEVSGPEEEPAAEETDKP